MPSGQAFAATAVITPLADTYITQQFPDGNNAGATELICGAQGGMAGNARNRPLFKFDPADSIPQGAKITGVRFTIVITKAPPAGIDSRFGLRRVLRDWNVTQTTWKLRLAPSVAWGAQGGAAGTDYSNAISASALISDEGPYVYDSTAALVADVQSWLDDPATNFGWILISDQESQAFSARRLASANHGTDLPALEVDYTLPVLPLIESPHLEQGLFSLQFDTEAGYCYAVEFRDSVGTGPWTTLTNVCAKLVPEKVLAKDPDPVSSRVSRFYRVSATGPAR